VILAKTVKGWALGSTVEGRNATHSIKKLSHAEIIEFRDRLQLTEQIPESAIDSVSPPLYRPPADSPEARYLAERRAELNGFVPSRTLEIRRPLSLPDSSVYDEFAQGSGAQAVSTTMAFTRLLRGLCRDDAFGRRVVPIIPDEARTFGMEVLFRELGIYASQGQLYEPVDHELLISYVESKSGQLLEEGITEAGSLASFSAAGTSYATRGVPMVPFFTLYSMFGFQRVGDSIWAGADMRAKGFLIGGTAGRTTLNGEGLQHQDGHSHLNAMAFPTVRAYDPAWAYETVVIVMDGMRRLYQEGETAIYYITVHNEDYEMPAMPVGIEEGIIRGIYKFKSVDVDKPRARVQLFGSGAILRHVLEAQKILAEKYGVASDAWSVTSYTQLRRDAQTCERWNMLHPDQPRKMSYIQTVLEGVSGPIISASDNVRAVGEQLHPYLDQDYFVLGCDGMGRSETRPALRRHFEVDAASVVIATLYRLSRSGAVPASEAAAAIRDLGYDPEKPNPLFA